MLKSYFSAAPPAPQGDDENFSSPRAAPGEFAVGAKTGDVATPPPPAPVPRNDPPRDQGKDWVAFVPLLSIPGRPDLHVPEDARFEVLRYLSPEDLSLLSLASSDGHRTATRFSQFGYRSLRVSPPSSPPATQVTDSAETNSSSAVSPSSASSTINLSSSTDEEGFVREEMDAAISESIEDQIREASGRIRPRGDLCDSSDDEENVNGNGKSFKKLRKVGPARPMEPVPPRRPPPTPPAAQVQAPPPPEGTAEVDISDLNDGDEVIFLRMGLYWQRGTVRARPTNPFQRTPQLYIEYEVMVNSRRRNKAYTLQDTSIVRRQL